MVKTLLQYLFLINTDGLVNGESVHYKRLSTANKLLIAFFIYPGHFVKEILNLHIHALYPSSTEMQPALGKD